jgi:hypothetical protein
MSNCIHIRPSGCFISETTQRISMKLCIGSARKNLRSNLYFFHMNPKMIIEELLERKVAAPV